MKTQKKLNFSKISLIQAIHKATYHPYTSTQCEANNLRFLKSLINEHSFLLKKKYVRKALSYGYCLAIKDNRKSVIELFKNTPALSSFIRG